jgi:hypothetical protein
MQIPRCESKQKFFNATYTSNSTRNAEVPVTDMKENRNSSMKPIVSMLIFQ